MIIIHAISTTHLKIDDVEYGQWTFYYWFLYLLLLYLPNTFYVLMNDYWLLDHFK